MFKFVEIEADKNLEPLADKWKSFGWNVIPVDGNKFEELIPALDQFEKIKDQPTVILANTVKGKGVSFMENQAGWHGKAPNKEQLDKALLELR